MTVAEMSVLLAGLLFAAGGTVYVTRAYNLYRPNFQGRHIPQMAGLFFVLWGTWTYGFEWLHAGLGTASVAAYFLVTLCFGLLGAWDDVAGDRSVGGFGGHFRALRRGRLTTGAAKALGGGFTALVAGGLVGWPLGGHMVLAALLVALSANTLNLLDTRPGRCLWGFGAGAFVLTLALWAQGSLVSGFLLYIAWATAVLLYAGDARGRWMLGDTGSNSFGAVLGVSGALFLPVWGQLLTVVLLIGFQLWCEKYSLSRVIEQNALLRRLDAQIGVRGDANRP